MAGEVVNVPLTVVQALINVPILQTAPVILREEASAGDAKVSALTALQLGTLLDTDNLLVSRANVWSRKITLGTIAQYFGSGSGPVATRAAYSMVNNVTITLGSEVSARLSAGAVIDNLPLRMPVPTANGQRVEVLFRQRVNACTVSITPGQQDSPDGIAPLQNVVWDNTLMPPCLEIGTTVVFQYDKPTTTWSVIGVWNRYDRADVKDPVRDLGAKFDGATDVTAKFQASHDVAKKAALPGFTYGLGGKVVGQVGVAVVSTLQWSRWVSMEGNGALGSFIWRITYAGLSVPGEDAVVTLLDDGTGQAGIVAQGKFHNVAIDGRRSSIEGVGQPLRNHVRHGIRLDPADGTDRVFSAGDLQIMNMPGDALHIVNNDQLRGGNFKFTGNRRGVFFWKVKDGKLDQFGAGNNGSGGGDTGGPADPLLLLAANVFLDCASLKIDKVDLWTGGNSGPVPVALIKSCAKLVFGEGEVEGMLHFDGDNDNPNSKSFRQVLMNVLKLINLKVSVDLAAAFTNAGIAPNIVTGAGYVAHIKVTDHFGGRALECSFGFKLGKPESLDVNVDPDWAATPPFLIWFGTKVPTNDAHYTDYVKTMGDFDVTGSTFLWKEGKTGPGGVRTFPVVAFKRRVSNDDKRLKGYRVGTINRRLATVGPNEDELVCDGSNGTLNLQSNDYPLLYCALDPTRSMTDRESSGPGADPVTGYKLFNLPNLSTLDNASIVECIVFKQ